MEIKRIQLRGISRTPSDRLTDDGGCAESLNVQLDNTEIAPSFMPEDKTLAMGLPEGLQAERVFVHKTQSYENIICIVSNNGGLSIQSIHNGQKSTVAYLDPHERVSDITSLGNTVIILTDMSTHYLFFRSDKYLNLGTHIPLPKLQIGTSAPTTNTSLSLEIDLDELGIYGMYRAFGTDLYNKYLPNKINSDESIQKLLFRLNEGKASIAGSLGSQGVFCGPIYFMYGVTLFDGTVITTTPEILSRHLNRMAEYTWGLQLSSLYNDNNGNKEFVGGITASYSLESFYLTVTGKEDYDVELWRDLIQSVDIYVSSPIDTAPDYRRIEIVGTSDSTSPISGVQMERTANTNWGILDEKEQILGKGNFYRIKTFPLSLLEDNIIPMSLFAWSSAGQDVTETALATTPYQLPSDDIDQIFVDEMVVVADKSFVYNDTLLLLGGKNLLGYRGSACALSKISTTQYSARLKFILTDGVVVYSDSNMPITMSCLLTFASPKATSVEMIVQRDRKVYEGGHEDYEIETTYSYLILPMGPHPFIPCSYAYIGPSKNFAEYAFEKNGAMSWDDIQKFVDFKDDAAKYVSYENKVLISSTTNPFVTPKQKSKTFQSRIVGAAIATTALSQGQFGQFPVYVFTEDGIWALETAADGSFVTNKPLSRDVCVNPASITSIDNAVVFVSEQGVMLLQGSQAVNISPYMNGRHYTIENTAKTIIERQDFFCDLLPALSDNTHFLAFVKEATVAYDYAGRRLIFIKKDEKYQYIYKLDTQTWHKTAYGIDLVAPINSYPECLVQARKDSIRRFLYSNRAENQITPTELANLTARLKLFLPNITETEVKAYLNGEPTIDVTDLSEEDYEWVIEELDEGWETGATLKEMTVPTSRIYDLSTILDAAESKTPVRGVIATRPFDLGEPDVFKTITDVRIRGQFPKGAVKFILLGSNDGIHFSVINTLRGKSWKLFRLIILADLDATDRISWVDIGYETRFTNKLR